MLIPGPDAAVLFLGGQVTAILRFFLSRNIRIARDRVWAQTVASRGKGPKFWQPYVEEWDNPPNLDEYKGRRKVEKWISSAIGRFIVQKGEFCPSRSEVISS
jgi:hypothetical protein